jgi:branched-chain amino acid transport system ATP-binding protein
MAALIEAQALTRRFGGLIAVNGIDLSVAEGEFVSIIGPKGEIRFHGRPITGLAPEKIAALGMARTFQHGRVFANLSVLDNVLVGAHVRLRAVRPRVPLIGGALELALALVRPGKVREEERRFTVEARELLAIFGERLLPRAQEPAFSLSYANRRRLEIARALALKPKLLLLDEPTAGMNPTETAEMLDIILQLKRRGLTILMIEHKLDMVMQLSDRIIVMDDGTRIAEGPPQAVRSDPAVIEAYLGHNRVGQDATTAEDAPALL